MRTISGQRWANMNLRCKVGGYIQLKRTTYVGVTNGFENFQTFVEWSSRQIGYNCGWELDKDILSKGNKIYSAQHCVLFQVV